MGLRLIGMANSQLAFRRRFTMKHYLAPGFKRLCDKHNPINQWMFGGNIKSTIDDISKVNRMMAEANNYPTRGRGRGFLGGRGRFHSHGGYFRGSRQGGRRGGWSSGYRGRGSRGFSFQSSQGNGHGHSQRGRLQAN